ncbi:MAG: ABC transporter ATP-binding protein [Solirubrobacteraceae bacterium]
MNTQLDPSHPASPGAASDATAASEQPALVVSALTKRYGSYHALEDVDLTVAPGELVGLIGANGAGKSTLVKIACGLVRQSSGTATVCGAPADARDARRQLGYLAELFRFPGWCTAAEVLALHQRLAGSRRGQSERDELLELVDLSDVAHRRVERMSKGMQQRLGIAQALIGEPKLLLLDEPTSALDPAGRRAIRTLLTHLRDRGIAVLLNSHLLGELERVCDRIVILSHGRVVGNGSPEQLARPTGVEIQTAAGPKQFPHARREEIPRIVVDLIASGNDIYEVTVMRSTLEDTYLQMVDSQ